jgi:hypothetical protein|tara:strand:+ start:382 stop:588 length:207 start_codon:yes stop_codon:yes gene_type:complete
MTVTDSIVKMIDFNLAMFNNTAKAIKTASVKETHSFQDKYVETVNYLTESAKEFVEKNSIEKVFTSSK